MKSVYLLFVMVLMMGLYGCEESANVSTESKGTGIVSQNSTSLSDIPNLKAKVWYPQNTTVGTVFNTQLNGVSALWFIMDGQIKPGTKLELWFGDSKLSDSIVFDEKLHGTSYVPTALLEKVGDYPLYLVHAPSKKRFDIGIFKISPAQVTTPSLKIAPKSVATPIPSVDTSSTSRRTKAKSIVTQAQ